MRLPLSLFGSLSLLLLAACTPKKEPDIPEIDQAKPLEEPEEADEEEEGEEGSAKLSGDQEVQPLEPYFASLKWAGKSYSPQPGSPDDPDLDLFIQQCGKGDAALHRAATLAAQSQSELGLLPTSSELSFYLRKAGVGYVMPRLFSVDFTGHDFAAIAESAKEWAQKMPPMGEFRCGGGLVRSPDGETTLVLLQADVLADVQPFPTQAESGAWLDLMVDLHPDVFGASVIMLPPQGPPHPLVTEVDGSRTKTRLNLNLSGTYRIQMMGTLEGGPRPIVELALTVDDDPPLGPESDRVPGEDVFSIKDPPAEALFALLNSLREEEGLPALKENKKLTLLARVHARKMMQAGKIAHDLGDGNPDYRIASAGIEARATGENVARARTVLGIHRVLYGSASHRENMLLRRWNQAGIGIEMGKDGMIYATQLFIDD